MCVWQIIFFGPQAKKKHSQCLVVDVVIVVDERPENNGHRLIKISVIIYIDFEIHKKLKSNKIFESRFNHDGINRRTHTSDTSRHTMVNYTIMMLDQKTKNSLTIIIMKIKIMETGNLPSSWWCFVISMLLFFFISVKPEG